MVTLCSTSTEVSRHLLGPADGFKELSIISPSPQDLQFDVALLSVVTMLTCFQIYCFHLEGRRTQKPSPRLKKRDRRPLMSSIQLVEETSLLSDRIDKLFQCVVIMKLGVNPSQRKNGCLSLLIDMCILNQTCKSITGANEQMPVA